MTKLSIFGCPCCHAKPAIVKNRQGGFNIECNTHSDHPVAVYGDCEPFEQTLNEWNDDDWRKIGASIDMLSIRPIFQISKEVMEEICMERGIAESADFWPDNDLITINCPWCNSPFEASIAGVRGRSNIYGADCPKCYMDYTIEANKNGIEVTRSEQLTAEKVLAMLKK